jgi:hypothetical protein
MGTADAYGLNRTVNRVNGGRNVPFKWEVEDERSGLHLTDPSKVELRFWTYAQFLATFPTLPGRLPLPNRNVCADVGRTTTPIASDTGNTTPLKFTSGKFNIGFKVPSKPPASQWNCWVAWTSFNGDPNPGIVSLFTLA